MSLDVLKTRIKENNLSGVYLFSGSEEFMKDHYADRIRKIIDSAPLPEFNHIYFNAASGRLTELEDAVESLPYMSDIKLIEIVDLDIAKLNESELEVYSRVFSDMQDYLIILIVLRSSDKVEEKLSKESGLSNFVKLVESYGLVVSFETEKADKLTTWVAKHFNSKGVKFEANVPREIISVCGSDMYILQSEIEKLVLAFADKTITAADVRKYCCANSYYKYYDLTDALKRRDIVTAMKVWESLDIKRDDLSKAIGFIAKVFADILFIKQGIDCGKSIETIAKEHKLKQWMVKKIATSGGFDMRALNYAINQLASADIKIKSYNSDPYKIIELAFYRICSYGRKA